MKKANLIIKLIILCVFVSIQSANAQIGVGTVTPHASAMLDISSSNKGFLPPRVNLTSVSDITTIASPAEGLLVYNLGTLGVLPMGYYYWNGTSWATIKNTTGIAKFIRNIAQNSIAWGSNIVLNTTNINTISDYVSLNTSNGLITLQPGTYELNGSAGSIGGSTGDVRVNTMFYNGNSYVGSGGVSETGSAGNWNGMPQNEASYIITVPIGQTAQIYFKVINLYNATSLSGTGDFGDFGDAGRAWVVVRKYN